MSSEVGKPFVLFAASADLSAASLTSAYTSAAFPGVGIPCSEFNQMELYLSGALGSASTIDFLVLYSHDNTNWFWESGESVVGSDVNHSAAIHHISFSSLYGGAGGPEVHVPLGSVEFVKLVAKGDLGTSSTLRVTAQFGGSR